MAYVSLNGAWRLSERGKRQRVDATVPGCVHTDLLSAGKIPDPFFGNTEPRVQWVGERDWVYRREFECRASFLKHRRVELVCEGLDTCAEVKVNGKPVGTADNMFRRWTFDVTGVLHEGTNSIAVIFRSPLPGIAAKQSEHFLYSSAIMEFGAVSQGYVRKAQYQFGWDWAPRMVTCGIWRGIGLRALSTARISDVDIRQVHSPKGVTLDVAIGVARLSATPLHGRVTVGIGGKAVAAGEVDIAEDSGTGSVSIRIPRPRLWWPCGMGTQPLYEFQVELFAGGKKPVDTVNRRIGLRTLTLERIEDTWGESFRFVVNGEPFFAKGANWVPADSFPTRVTPDTYRRLLSDASDANMNMVRVWGGGIYEADIFYDICDELGLCVWQDFMMACCHIPVSDGAFVDNLTVEARQQVQRLRHHPCLALWCGNNEFEMGGVGWDGEKERMPAEGYRHLFDEVLPGVVNELDPGRDYWPCSPHTPGDKRREFNLSGVGDAHLWGVWARREPVESYCDSTHRFVSEFGFQAFPVMDTVARFSDECDRELESAVMLRHQRAGRGNDTIRQYVQEYLGWSESFEDQVVLSQIMQAYAIQTGVEHWRRQPLQTMGALYWMLNDCWPVVSWSSIDYYGRWKALHYAARRFFAPVLISGSPDPDHAAVDVYLLNDTRAKVEETLRWYAVTPDGNEAASGRRPITMSAGRGARIQTLRLRKPFEQYGPENLLIFLELAAAGNRVTSQLVTYARPRDIPLQKPSIRHTVRPFSDDGTRWRIALESDRPALWVNLDFGDVTVRLSDNFFHLRPKRKFAVVAAVEGGCTQELLSSALTVRNLTDHLERDKAPLEAS